MKVCIYRNITVGLKKAFLFFRGYSLGLPDSYRVMVSFISAPNNKKIKQIRPTEKNNKLNDAAVPVRSF